MGSEPGYKDFRLRVRFGSRVRLVKPAEVVLVKEVRQIENQTLNERTYWDGYHRRTWGDILSQLNGMKRAVFHSKGDMSYGRFLEFPVRYEWWNIPIPIKALVTPDNCFPDE